MSKPFNREKFLLWMLTGLLTWQCALFTYGTVMCANVEKPRTVQEACPNLADNYSKFVQVSLGALLGLLAGTAVTRQPSSSDDPDGPLASRRPLPPVSPSPTESPEKDQARG